MIESISLFGQFRIISSDASDFRAGSAAPTSNSASPSSYTISSRSKYVPETAKSTMLGVSRSECLNSGRGTRRGLSSSCSDDLAWVVKILEE